MSEQKLINAFHELLEDLQTGQSLEELLLAYPDLADELRSMLQTAESVPNARVDTTELRATRSRLDKQFESQLAALDFPKKSSRRPLFAFVATLALVFLGIWIFLPRDDNSAATEIHLTQSTQIATETVTVTVIPTTEVPSPSPSASPTTAVPATNPTNALPEMTAAACTAPSDWLVYSIKSGDTLSGIALNSGTTVEALSFANCIMNPRSLIVGQRIYVPRLWEDADSGGASDDDDSNTGSDGGAGNSGSGSSDDDDEADDDNSGSDSTDDDDEADDD